MREARNAREVITPQHELREKIAKEAEAKKAKKVVKEWVEVVKRVPHEDGKIILKTLTSSGYEHSWYVGRESKCKAWLAEQEKAGKYKPHKDRSGG